MRDLEFLCQSRKRFLILKILKDRHLVSDCAVSLEDCYIEDLRRGIRSLEKNP